MPVEQSAIQLVSLPELWPPLDQGSAATARALPDPSDVKPLPLDQGRTLTLDQGPALPPQFAVLLVEGLAGVRPVRQLTPWMSKRGSIHLNRLIPLFHGGSQPRVLRVLATRPTPNVVEMTIVAVISLRTRALAIRLEHSAQPNRWLCTDIEAA
jgi:Family of unknown function (DUF6459)